MKIKNFFLSILIIFNICVQADNNELNRFDDDVYNDKKNNKGNSHSFEDLGVKIDNIAREMKILRKVIEAYAIKLNTLVENSTKELGKKTDDELLESLTSNDEDSYKQAYQALLNKKYSVEIKVKYFSNFIIHYPSSNYLPNAYYWLGELYLREKDYEEANKNFGILIDKYSSSTKTPSAMLKRAYGLIGLEKISDAKQQLIVITQNYPNTTVASIASKKLANLPN